MDLKPFIRSHHAIIAVSVLIIASLCDPASSASANPGRVVEVPIQNFLFNDGRPVEIEVGDSVVWVNKDQMPHSASSTEQSSQKFDTGFIKPGAKSDPVRFLKQSSLKGFPYACDVHERMLEGTVIVRPPGSSTPITPPSAATIHHQPPSANHHQQSPSVHSMIVTGADPSSLFLHHYGLFNNPNHEFHVTLEARLEDSQAQHVYAAYRQKFSDALCIIDPELFLLAEIQAGTRKSFHATFSHAGDQALSSHQTQWGTAIPGLENVAVTITRIIQFRHFDPKDQFPPYLVYQLYGNEKEVYLAHEITAAPNFEEVVKLAAIPAFLTADIIARSPLLAIPSKQLQASGNRTIRTAVLSNSTHVLLAPPVGTINPVEPLTAGEVLDVLLEGDSVPHQLTVGRTIFFDTRIINR